MIHVPTLMLALCMANLAFAALIGCFVRKHSGVLGLTAWHWAKLAQGLGYLSAFLASLQAEGALPALAVSLLMAGAWLDVLGFYQFLQASRPALRLAPVCVAGLLAYAGVVTAGGSLAQHIAAVAIYLAVLAVLLGSRLLRSGPHSLLQRVIGLANIAFVGALMLRVAAVSGALPANWLLYTQVLVYMAAVILTIVNGFGFVLLSREQDEASMRRLAAIDPLTGVANRRALLDRAEQCRQVAERAGSALSLLVIDIDHFKSINDRFGHAAGDDALRAFAAMAAQCLRDGDELGRIGGEEFALLLPDTDAGRAVSVAERLRRSVAALELRACGTPFTISASIGVSTLRAEESLQSALARADAAMYEAKRAGRNCVRSGIDLCRQMSA